MTLIITIPICVVAILLSLCGCSITSLNQHTEVFWLLVPRTARMREKWPLLRYIRQVRVLTLTHSAAFGLSRYKPEVSLASKTADLLQGQRSIAMHARVKQPVGLRTFVIIKQKSPTLTGPAMKDILGIETGKPSLVHQLVGLQHCDH